MTSNEPTSESDRLSVGETEPMITLAVPAPSIGRNRRVSIGGREFEVGGREFGLALVVSGVGFVGYAANLALLENQTGALAALATISALVFLVGLSIGLVGAWLRYADASRLVKPAVILTVVSAVVFAAIDLGLDGGLGSSVGILAVASALGVPAGLSLLGVGLRRSVGTATWLSLAAALPLVLAGGVVWIAGLVVESGLIAAAGGVLAALGLLTAVPLGVEMVREGADTGVEASAGPELGV